MTIVLKIFVMLSIISFVLQNLGKGPLAILVICVMSYFIIFDYFYIFGGVYILYMLALLGGVHLMIDFFFAAPHALGGGGGGGGGEELEQRSGIEYKEQQQHLMHKGKRMMPLPGM
ncbi:MAG: hypothetical protein NTY48_04815 [Candidatus Diapherotrites archaeon]|nr:hypothetical protein [Candidatus Diapherotrites archaeon]